MDNAPKPAQQFGSGSFSPDEERNIGNCLAKKLGKDNTTSRPGAGNSKYTYIESWRGISLANSIFGFNGWSCSIVDLSPDFIEEDRGRFSVGVTAVVRITLKDGTSHEDVGYGTGENPRRGAAIEKAKKEAVSDARKRALRLFGDALGNCLYDKQHLKRISSGKNSQADDILDYNDLPFRDQTFGALESPHQTPPQVPQMAPETNVAQSVQPESAVVHTNQNIQVKQEPSVLTPKPLPNKKLPLKDPLKDKATLSQACVSVKLEPKRPGNGISPPRGIAVLSQGQAVGPQRAGATPNPTTRYQPYPINPKIATFAYKNEQKAPGYPLPLPNKQLPAKANYPVK